MKTYRRPKETPAIPVERIKRDLKEAPQVSKNGKLTMTAAAQALGIHRDTLKRWIKEGKVPDAPRNDKNSYRMFSPDDVEKIRKIRDQDALGKRGDSK